MALGAVNGLLAKLADDADLHDDLKQPQVQVAMRHWTGQDRLPPEQAERLMGDYRVMAVLNKIKALQTECQRAGIPVPLDAVLRRERALELPGGGGCEAPKQQEQKKAQAKGEGKKKGKQAEAVVSEAAVTSEPAAAPAATSAPASAVVGPRSMKRRPPQTVFEWLHLLSPLLILVFGILYALTRAAGTGGSGTAGGR